MAEAHTDDARWMARALELAARGVARAHPNPMVGAVIVRDGRVVGEGFHLYDRRDHAEVLALRQAGPRARGATLYVNLEPCSHTGRTPPCVEAIIAAGIRRVVAAMPDPNPAVHGRGFARLRRAGIAVTMGVARRQAEELNDAFAVWIRTRRPRVLLKAAMTLDGQLSFPPGYPRRITGPEAHRRVQELRHAADAVLTGIGTVLADDPLLTDRTGLPRRRPLLRVILDSRLRLPVQSRLVRSAADDVVVFTIEAAPASREWRLRQAGVEVVRVPARNRHPDLGAVLAELGRREILSLLVEAGARVNGALLAAGLVDRVVFFYAPRMAGRVTVPLAASAQRFRKLPKLLEPRLGQYGEDFAVEGYLRDVYRNH